jgi:hypothetical protein
MPRPRPTPIQSKSPESQPSWPISAARHHPSLTHTLDGVGYKPCILFLGTTSHPHLQTLRHPIPSVWLHGVKSIRFPPSLSGIKSPGIAYGARREQGLGVFRNFDPPGRVAMSEFSQRELPSKLDGLRAPDLPPHHTTAAQLQASSLSPSSMQWRKLGH